MVAPANGTLPNIVPASVLDLTYLGDHIRVRMSVLGSDQFIVKIPNGASHLHLRCGESVRLGWRMEDCRALDY